MKLLLIARLENNPRRRFVHAMFMHSYVRFMPMSELVLFSTASDMIRCVADLPRLFFPRSSSTNGKSSIDMIASRALLRSIVASTCPTLVKKKKSKRISVLSATLDTTSDRQTLLNVFFGNSGRRIIRARARLFRAFPNRLASPCRSKIPLFFFSLGLRFLPASC